MGLRPNAAAWSTEWAILSAGNPTRSYKAGILTHDCRRADLGDSHVAWPWGALGLSLRGLRPCGHEFRFISPEKEPIPLQLVKEVREHNALWLPSERLDQPSPRRLRLLPVRSENGWRAMVEMREEVEVAFPGYREGVARRLVGQIRHRKRHLAGDWYLAVIGDRVVGGIGLILFDTVEGRIGRLQDVDIVPAFQGWGLGRELLCSVSEQARLQGLNAICLRADGDDWPQQWYLRFGFEPVGTWRSFSVREVASE